MLGVFLKCLELIFHLKVDILGIENTPEIYDVLSVYADTGLEYPEIREFVKSFGNVTIVRPKMSFRDVIQKYADPVVSKEISRRVQYARKAVAEKTLKGSKTNNSERMWR